MHTMKRLELKEKCRTKQSHQLCFTQRQAHSDGETKHKTTEKGEKIVANLHLLSELPSSF